MKKTNIKTGYTQCASFPAFVLRQIRGLVILGRSKAQIRESTKIAEILDLRVKPEDDRKESENMARGLEDKWAKMIVSEKLAR